MTNENSTSAPTPVNPAPAGTSHPVGVAHESRLTGWLLHRNTPYVVGVIVLAAAALVGLATRTDVRLPTLIGAPHIVVFDPVKFINAQRAAASILVTSPTADMALTMTQVAKQAEAVIAQEARGAIVLVKQAVVSADSLPDITEQVLLRFGLPTDVPTVSMKPESFDVIAPTDLAFSPEQLREDYRMELQSRSQRLADEQFKKDKQSSILP